MQTPTDKIAALRDALLQHCDDLPAEVQDALLTALGVGK